ncbi:MAG: hypothetical protein WDA47_08325 [Bacilli bacterium]
MKKESIIILILSVLLIGSLGFIGFNAINNSIINMQIELRNEGYQMAIADLMTPLEMCQVITLSLAEDGSDAVNVFSVECLENMQGGGINDSLESQFN